MTMSNLLLSTALTALALTGTGCGGDDGDGGGGRDAGGSGSGTNNDPTCSLTAMATPDTSARTITGVGLVSCGAPATIQIEVCVQWNPSGSFVDIQCQSGTTSNVMTHAVENVASCGIANGRMFRTRANASINGTALDEMLSPMVGCE